MVISRISMECNSLDMMLTKDTVPCCDLAITMALVKKTKEKKHSTPPSLCPGSEPAAE